MICSSTSVVSTGVLGRQICDAWASAQEYGLEEAILATFVASLVYFWLGVFVPWPKSNRVRNVISVWMEVSYMIQKFFWPVLLITAYWQFVFVLAVASMVLTPGHWRELMSRWMLPLRRPVQFLLWPLQAWFLARERRRLFEFEEAEAAAMHLKSEALMKERFLEMFRLHGCTGSWLSKLDVHQLSSLERVMLRRMYYAGIYELTDRFSRAEIMTPHAVERVDSLRTVRHGTGLREQRLCKEIPTNVRNVSGRVESWLKAERSADVEVEAHTLGGEVFSMLGGVRQLCEKNRELVLVDAALTFVGTVYLSNGTWAATMLASKEFVKNIAMFLPAQRIIQATLATVEAAKPSPDAFVFEELVTETPSPMLDIEDKELEKYIRMCCKWERKPSGHAYLYFNGELSVEKFAEATVWKREMDVRFKRLYGFDSHAKQPYEFARACLEYKELAAFVDPDDTLRDSNVSSASLVAAAGRAKSMGHLIIGNAIVLALGGILSVNLLKTHAPVLAEIAFNIMGPGRDFAKLVKSVCGLIKDSAVYFGYVISGDVTLLQMVEDPLTACLVTQDKLESDLRDKRGDQARLLELIEDHSAQVSRRHGLMRRATTPADAAPWGQLLLRAFHLRDDARRRRGSKTKMESLLFTAEGPVGAGKTTVFTEWAERIVSAVLDEPAPDDGSFGDVFMQSDPKFYDGIVVGQKVIGYDDTWGHIKSAPPGDPSVKVFLQMISKAVVMAPMSDIKDKGEIPLTPAFVFVCENDLNKAVGKFTDIVSAVRRRSQLHFVFKYRDGMVAGQQVAFDDDIIVTVQRYLTPRTNDLSLGQMEDLMTGSIDEAMAYALKVAEAYGKNERARLAQRRLDDGTICRTCRQRSCTLGAGVPRALHFDKAYQQAVEQLVVPSFKREKFEDEELPQEMVLVSATVVFPLLYCAYWLARSFRMAWLVQDARDSEPQTWGQFVALFSIVPAAWLFGWTAFAVYLPLHAAACLLFANDTGYFAWRPWLELRGKILTWIMAGDRLLVRFAPWVRARYVMARLAMGYSVDAEQAIWAFKQTSKYQVLLRLIIVLTAVAAAFAAKSLLTGVGTKASPIVVSSAVRTEEIPFSVTMTSLESCDIDGLKRVCRRLVVHRGADTNTAVYIPIGHNLALSVAHLFPERGDFLVTQTLAVGQSYKDGAPYQLPKRNVERPDSDFAVVRDAHVVVYDKSLSVRELPKVHREAWMVLFSKDGSVSTRKVLAVAVREENVSRPGWKHDVAQCYKVMAPTEHGMCGSPLLVRDEATDQWIVFATLMGSDGVSMSVFQAVTGKVKQCIDERLAEWPDGPSLQSLHLVSARLPVKVVAGPLHSKSALQWAPLSSIAYVGRQVPERSSTPKCGMVHTSFHDVVEAEYGKVDEFMKPEWRPKMWPGVSYPTGMMTQHVEAVVASHDGVAAHRDACEIVFDEFRSVFSPQGRTGPLSTREALNGVPGRIKGINRSTSIGGWGRTGPKSSVLKASTCPHYPNGVTLPPEFDARVTSIEQQWSDGQSVSPTCRIIPKMNEVRTKPVARQINVVELEWIVAARKYLEPIHEAMRKNEKYASMIGRSPVSKEWAKQDARLKEVNPEVGVDADGVHFDKVHGGTVREYTRKGYQHVASSVGYDAREVRVVGQILEDMANAWQCFMGEVFVALFGIISGVPGTGDYQTFVCWFIVRVALVILYGREVLRTRSLASIHGGDDVKFTVAKEFGYSGAAFADTMRELGYKFTSDTDKTKPPEAVPHAETTFYKRKFLVDGSRVLAPLAEKSVRKMLMWRDADASVPARVQEAEILRTAVRESFMLGKEGYARESARIARIGASAGYQVTIPDWDQLASEFDAGTLKTWHYEPEIEYGTLCDCDRPISLVSGVETNVKVEEPIKVQVLDGVDAGAIDDIAPEARLLALPLLREVSDALSRPIIIGESAWTPGVAYSVYPLSGLLSNAILGRNLNYFVGHRAVLCVKLSVVAPPMACGVLVASLYANNNIDATTSVTVGHAGQIITQDCSTLIDIAVGNSAILRKQLPRWTDATFTYASDAYRGLHCIKFAMAELVGVSAATAAGATAPTVYIWAWLEDAEQLGPSSIENVSGRVDEWLPKYSAGVAQFAMRAVSAFGGVVRAGHAVTGALIAAGFAYVAQLPQLTWVRERHGPFFATGEGVDASVRLTLAPKSMTVDNQAIMRGARDDLLSLKSLMSRPSLMGTTAWTMAQTAHTRIASLPVHPCVGGAQGTPMSWLSTMFNMWTGSLKITCFISCPSTVRGSLIFAYTPNSSVAAPVYGDLTQCQPVVLDVAGSTSIEFIVPWNQELAALQCTDPASVNFPTTTSGVGFATKFNGYISVFVQQPLISSGATAFATSLVWTVVAGDDFAFLDPNLDMATRINLVSANIATPLFQVETRHVTHKFSGAIRTPQQVAALSGGEIISLRDLIKRRSVHYTQRLAAGGDLNWVIAVDFPWFLAGVSSLQSATSNASFQCMPCFLSQAAIPFAAWSGSVRHTVSQVQNVGDADASTGGRPVTMIVSRMPGNLTTGGHARWRYVGDLGTQLFSYLGMGNGTDVSTSAAQINTVSVEVPYISSQYALPVPLNTAGGGPCIRTAVINGSDDPVEVGLVDYVSAGDDFDLFEWIGVPALTIVAAVPTNNWSAS